MTVAIHPSEARPQTAGARAPSRLRGPVIAGVSLLALGAFAAGSFTFFSDLADPRAKPRTSMAAASWPELKDGVPALTDSANAVAPVLNLPRPASAEPERTAVIPETSASTPPEPVRAVVTQAAPQPASVPVVEARAAVSAPEVKRAPPIENVTTLAVPSKPVALVAPRAVAAIAPARAETVKAKPAQPSRFVSLAPDGGKPDAVVSKPRMAVPKAEVPQPKAQTKVPTRTPATKVVAEAQPTPAPATASDEPEVMGVKIPGGRQLREGLQAVGSLFGGKSGEE